MNNYNEKIKSIDLNSSMEHCLNFEYILDTMSNNYSYYHVKDRRMLTLCYEILMFWDGKSRGSYDNLIDGIAKHKTTKAVLRPFKVIEFKNEEELRIII